MPARLFSLCVFVSLSAAAHGQTAQVDTAQPSARPLRALLVTGGCCHDYDRQKLILTRGISARANVRWTVVQQGGKTTDTKIPLYDDPNWAEGFDVVVHNECFAHVKDKEFVDRILKPHREGVPAILIHCAMHCYRTGDDRWFEFVGMQSPGHGPHYTYDAENVKPAHPIMQGFGKSFTAPKGELYHSMKVFPSATPLASAKRRSDGQSQVCVWVNDYRYGNAKEGTRVFGTTIGHYNETMVEPKYLDMLAKAVLWATGRDPEKDFRPADEDTNARIAKLVSVPVNKKKSDSLPGNCCGAGNFAYGCSVTSKTVQQGNEREHLTDGRLDTRFCPSSSAINEWVTVDLAEPRTVNHLRLHWEKAQGVHYRYIVEASGDNENWTRIVDRRGDREGDAVPQGTIAHRIEKQHAEGVRYIRVTFLGADRGLWGSIWELEASDQPLPELENVSARSGAASASISDVAAPPGFDVTMFGKPPVVNYPVCITAAVTGEVFVGVDEQGSLGKEKGRGRILRCVDADGDGTADDVTVFAEVDHPRGLVYDDGSLWVLHPPMLSVFHDTDGDGVAEESEVLVRGISTDEVAKRGADHTTNGIAMGIDGWIYIAVGDFGFNKAVGVDGRTLSKRGGGVVRVRPDGTGMEIYAWGLRNIVDVAIDPFMNVFTRDNTNDGGGWDIRLSHIMQTAEYGYPSLYRNFTEETMPPLADYGGGSGCGAMFFHDERWPEGFNNLLLTCDWGLSKVFSHALPANGATFDAQQDDFLKLPRPTDICADGSGRMYVASWKNGKFNYDGPNIGFVARVTPSGFVPKPVPHLKDLNSADLVQQLAHPSAVVRLAVQRELLRRDRDGLGPRLAAVCIDQQAPLHARVAAIWTIRQAFDSNLNSFLSDLLEFDDLTEHCLRAIGDRPDKLTPFRPHIFVDALSHNDERVRAAAVVGLGRVISHALREGWVIEDQDGQRPVAAVVPEYAGALLPLTVERETEFAKAADDWRVPHPERVLPHLAVRALVRMSAVETCLQAINGPYRSGAFWALRSMHSEAAVSGLFRALSESRDPDVQREIWTTLIRLYFREGKFTVDSPRWWGTRPDTTGPYYHRVTWSQSERIAAAVRVALAEADQSLATHIREQLRRHLVELDGADKDQIAAMQPQQAIRLPQPDPNDPGIVANMTYENVVTQTLQRQGDPGRGQKLFVAQSCIACHTIANGQQPKGPHLVDIGKRYKPGELLESMLKPSTKIAQGFDTWTFVLGSGKSYTGFVVLESAETITIRQTDGLSREFPRDEVDERVKQEPSMMPQGVVSNLAPQQLADLLAYLQSLH